MRIAIDVSSMMPPRTMLGNHTRCIVRELLALDKENQYLLFFNSLLRAMPAETWLHNTTRLHICRRHIPTALLHQCWEYLHQPSFETLTSTTFDLIHTTSSHPAPNSKVPMIFSVHDNLCMTEPDDSHTRARKNEHEILTQRLNNAAAVLCPSEICRTEILKLSNLESGRVYYVPPGVDMAHFRPLSDADPMVENVRRRLNLPLEFLLAVVTTDPEKNLKDAIQAMALLQESMGADTPPLICILPQGFQGSSLDKFCREHGVSGHIIFVNYLPEQDMPALYSMATAMLFLSEHVGFGSAMLEAMACGTPVIALDSPALIEVGADAAIYVPHTEHKTMAVHLCGFCERAERRLHYAQLGLKRAELFSWRNTARKILAIYQGLEYG